MVSIYDVRPAELIKVVSEKLKALIKMPDWARFVKTGAHKERPPSQEDWWCIRAAAILRTVHKDGPVGISKLRSKYGGARNRGVKPHIFMKGSGKVIRTIVQQLETAGLIQKRNAKTHKGRVIAPEGQKLLEKSASEVYKSGTKSVRSAAKTADGAAEKSAAKQATDKGSKGKAE